MVLSYLLCELIRTRGNREYSGFHLGGIQRKLVEFGRAGMLRSRYVLREPPSGYLLTLRQLTHATWERASRLFEDGNRHPFPCLTATCCSPSHKNVFYSTENRYRISLSFQLALPLGFFSPQLATPNLQLTTPNLLLPTPY